MKKLLRLLLIMSLLFAQALHAEITQTIIVGDFENSDLSGWENEEFHGQTRYRIKQQDNKSFLAATSVATASGLIKEVDIDLLKTAEMHWSWKIHNDLKNNNETSKPGDDFSARIYIIFKTGPLPWQTYSICYVSASSMPVDSYWKNPYTSNVIMFAVNKAGENLNKWVSFKRNIRSDIKKLFNKDITRIKAVSIMTDTDNTGASASTYYRNIYFTAP